MYCMLNESALNLGKEPKLNVVEWFNYANIYKYTLTNINSKILSSSGKRIFCINYQVDSNIFNNVASTIAWSLSIANSWKIHSTREDFLIKFKSQITPSNTFPLSRSSMHWLNFLVIEKILNNSEGYQPQTFGFSTNTCFFQPELEINISVWSLKIVLEAFFRFRNARDENGKLECLSGERKGIGV